jgi:hypothetical protein
MELRAVWGSGGNDVWAVGDGGTLLHYDGDVWDPQSSPTVNDLYGLWGRAADDVFAVGDYGTILHRTRR